MQSHLHNFQVAIPDEGEKKKCRLKNLTNSVSRASLKFDLVAYCYSTGSVRSDARPLGKLGSRRLRLPLARQPADLCAWLRRPIAPTGGLS